ncbi:hypothetical protein ACLB1R_07915 [Escherichia coli]
MRKVVCAFKEHLAAFSSNVTILSIPGNKENSPFAAMDAMLAHASKNHVLPVESANFSRFTGSVSPQIYRHFTHIKVFHTRSRPVLFIVIVQVTVDGYRQLG